jgi:hypothetical protein
VRDDLLVPTRELAGPHQRAIALIAVGGGAALMAVLAVLWFACYLQNSESLAAALDAAGRRANHARHEELESTDDPLAIPRGARAWHPSEDRDEICRRVRRFYDGRDRLMRRIGREQDWSRLPEQCAPPRPLPLIPLVAPATG